MIRYSSISLQILLLLTENYDVTQIIIDISNLQFEQKAESES
jgi:hypothetical protein